MKLRGLLYPRAAFILTASFVTQPQAQDEMVPTGQVQTSKRAAGGGSGAENYAASESGEPNSPELVSRSKGLNPFMAAKLADAVGKG